MEFLLLGPLEAHHGGARVDLGRRRVERCLLGLLLLEAGRVVPVDRLATLLWDDEPPAHARRSLQVHISRIRSLLDPDRDGRYGIRIDARGDGYLADTDPLSVDAHRFRSLVEHAGNEPDPDKRAKTLRQALALWRGPLLADVATDRLRDRVSVGLDELRLSARETCLQADLEAGRHRQAIPELTDLVTTHPLRERLIAALMLALYRDGRQPDALDIYRQARTHLNNELGLEPGQALRQLHQSILRADADLSLPRPAESAARRRTSTGPAQLPAKPRHFTGRGRELQILDNLLEVEQSTVVVSAIAGMGGIGKTALAVHWAHRVRDRFPDGQLYVNLRGYATAPPMTPTEALARFLRSLGVPAEQVPDEQDEAATLYRTLLADRRTLVLLDNANSVDQVRPLLPGGSNLVVVTSRDRLSGLVAIEGASRLTLDALTPNEASKLLHQIIGDERTQTESDAVATLARACANLPLALRIAAANLTDQPDLSIASYVEHLVNGPLATLTVDGDDQAAVRAAFASSYQRLSEQARRMFRLLSLGPDAGFIAPAAAALTGTDTTQAQPLLETLTSAHLIDEHTPGRYTFHDLIRQYGLDRADTEESTDTRAEAIDRLLDWYLAIAEAANDVLTPQWAAVTPTIKHRPTELPFRQTHDEVHAFLDQESATIPAVVRYATENGRDNHAWQLAYLVFGFFDGSGHLLRGIEMTRWGVTAACRVGDPAAERIARNIHAALCNSAWRSEEALTHLRRTLELARAEGNRRSEANIYNNTGRALRQLGRPAEATDAYRRSIALFTEVGEPYGAGMALNNLGNAYHQLGNLELAVETLLKALAHWRETGNQRGESYSAHGLGELYLQMGELDAARERLDRALTLARSLGHRDNEVAALNDLGQVLIRQGDHRNALTHLHSSLALCRQLGSRHYEANALQGIGEAHLRLGDLTTAREYLDAALSVRQTAPDPYQEAHLDRIRGQLERATGDAAAARRCWQHAVSLFEKAGATREAEGVRADCHKLLRDASAGSEARNQVDQ